MNTIRCSGWHDSKSIVVPVDKILYVKMGATPVTGNPTPTEIHLTNGEVIRASESLPEIEKRIWQAET